MSPNKTKTQNRTQRFVAPPPSSNNHTAIKQNIKVGSANSGGWEIIVLDGIARIHTICT